MGTELDVEDLAGLPTRSARGAGMVPDRHHWFPQELDRSGFYRDRGFAAGEVDEHASEFSEGEHQALHGGGNYRLAKQHWPEGSWNERLKMDYADLEERLGRKLGKDEIMEHNLTLRSQFNVANAPIVPYKAPR